MNPTIKELTTKNKQLIAQFLCKGREICKEYLNENKNIDVAQLDLVFFKWAKDNKSFSNEEIANGLGTLFGEKIASEFKFNWKIVTDQHGAEYAVVDDYTGSIIFPINSIWKRIASKIDTKPFFLPMWQTIKAHIETEKKPV